MTDISKLHAANEERQRKLAYLDHRIPELHAAKVKGADARRQALAEYGRKKR